MIQSANRFRWFVLGSVVASRVVYAISWFDIAASPLQIMNDFAVDRQALGVLASAFTIGVGIFQIPAGGLAARWGAKRTASLGLLIMAISGILSGLAPTFLLLGVARFVVGIGAAFFFAPAIGIITPLFDDKEKGFVIGLYNGAFGIGAGIGLFGWAVLDEVIGWRLGMMIAGISIALLAAENFLVIRDDAPKIQSTIGSLGNVMRNRSIWFWATGLLGFWGALYCASYFLVDFSESQLALGPFQAGILSASINLVAVVGGPIGGRLSDHFGSRKPFMLIPGIIFGLGIMTLGFLGLPLVWLVPSGLGFIEGFIFAALYASPTHLKEIGPRYAASAIGLINSIQILGSLWMPIVFAVLAQSMNYSTAWLFTGISTLIFLPLVALTKEPFSRNDAGSDTAPSQA